MAAEEKKLEPVEVKVKNATGGDAGSLKVELGNLGIIRTRLMHSAVVMYHANMRSGTHCTKTRSEIAGSTKKLYRQKGTGRARAGSRKAGQRKHGGTIFGPKPRDYSWAMPKKQRREALKSAVLSKLMDKQVQIVDTFGLTDVKTKAMSTALKALGLVAKKKNPSLLIITDGYDKNVHLSSRNIEGVEVMPVQDLNAREALKHRTLCFTKAAFDKFQQLATRKYPKRARKLHGTRKAKNAPAAAAGEKKTAAPAAQK